MPLFQKTVRKEFVARQNQEQIQEAYAKFQAHFGNAAIQKNIAAAKEEQYQEGFLKDLFVDILGYTLNPQPDFNLTTEQKNETDSKKADAAILAPQPTSPLTPEGGTTSNTSNSPFGGGGAGLVIGIIELKSAKTVLLQSVEYQAFGYKNHHANCRYVITSNFTKLRFYLDNAIEFEEFDLFALSLPDFAVLYTLLHCKNLLADLPLKLKQQSIEREEELTLSFYNDYENFKDVLFLDISNKNRQIDKFTLFQKTQKLLDRIVFMCFAEDKGLLPSNLIKKIITEWENLRDYNEYKPLFAIFLKHFGYINNGFKNKLYDIFGYNGGLFAEDEILSQLQMTDELLMNQCNYLSRYDFDSDIDVNVLGHIFEHSLNQLDAKRAELIETAQKMELGEKPKENGKRKIDGIFYTPAYITAYMVQETVGKLCEEKKVELGLTPPPAPPLLGGEFLTSSMSGSETPLPIGEGQGVGSALETYETWLATIRVLDPACGSGAFLNQVLTFFIAEYAWLEAAKKALLPPKVEEKTEKKAKKVEVDIFAAPVPMEVKIVKEEKNIIHQILENNIFGVDLNEESVEITKLSLWLKTASMRQKLNNLTDNIKCGNSLIDDKAISEKAFEWGKEFPMPMNEGGFTLIVGNPPYVTVNKQNPITTLYTWNTDLYLMFFEKCFRDLLRKNIGMLGFITPRYWLVNKVNSDFRNFMLTQVDIWQLTETSPFPEANTECVITLLHNYPPKSDEIQVKEDNKEKMIAVNVIKKSYSLRNGSNEILTFLSKDAIEILIQIEKNSTYLGKIIHSKRGMEIGKNDLRNSQGKATLIGQDVNRYQINFENTFVSESAKDYKRLQNFFNPNLIYLRRVANCLIATMSDVEFAYNKNLYGLQVENSDFDAKYILALLNSKLLDFYYKKKFSMKKVDIFPEIQTYLFEALPIHKATISEQQPFVKKVAKILLLNRELKKIQKGFIQVFQDNFKQQLSKKSENWIKINWADFLQELKKLSIDIPLREQMKWKEFFNEEQKNAKSVSLQIQTLENQIDKLVYALYGLSEEEIKIVEM